MSSTLRPNRLSRVCTLGAIAWVVAVAPAQAGTRFDLGQGGFPSIAVDAAGATHVVYQQHDSATPTDVFRYCRLAQGQTACLGPLTLSAPAGSNVESPLVVTAPGNTVYVIAGDYVFKKGYLWTSTTGGASFTGPTVVGDGASYGTNEGNAVLSSTGALYLASWNPSTYFQSITPGATATTEADLGGHFIYDTEVGLYGSAPEVPVVAAWRIPSGTPDEFGFWRWSGVGDINDPTTWAGPTIVGLGQNTHLAQGPQGLFIISHQNRPGMGFPDSYSVLRFDGTTFVKPVVVAASGVTSDENALFEDPTASGELHAVWRLNSSPYELEMASSSDGGASFGPPAKIVTDPTLMIRPHGATAADGRGFVVWDHNTIDGQVSAASLDPLALAPPVPGKSVNVTVVSGQVFIKYPAAGKAATRSRGGRAAQTPAGFVPLKGLASVPIGSTVDTARGRIAMTSAANRAGAIQSGQFYAGVFQVKQQLAAAKKAPLTTELVLKGLSTSLCGSKAGARSARRSTKVLGKLWADGKGRFRTRGRNSSATVRGTKWLTQDRCDGTLTSVSRGAVTVRDLRRKRTVVVRAGHSYLARG